MRILFIVGNGFDINLGLKSSFSEFKKHYLKIPNKSNEIIELKKDIVTWSDFEKELGNYTGRLTKSQFNKIFFDVLNSLGDYLDSLDKKFDTEAIDFEEFLKDLMYPEVYLPFTEKRKIQLYRQNHDRGQILCDIVTFNYTYVLDRLIHEERKKVKFKSYHNKKENQGSFNEILHIHGYTDRDMILGLNDTSQLANKEFHGEKNILDCIIKNNTNQAIRHGRELAFKGKINASNLIIIFGSSIGETDKIWWKDLGSRLLKGVPIIIFRRGTEKISDRVSFLKNAVIDNMKEDFLEKADLSNLSQSQKESAKENLFIALDTPMFKNLIKETVED